jgi:hypothetical protein
MPRARCLAKGTNEKGMTTLFWRSCNGTWAEFGGIGLRWERQAGEGERVRAFFLPGAGPVGCQISGVGQSAACNARLKRVRRPCRQQHLPRTTSKIVLSATINFSHGDRGAKEISHC